MLKSIELRNVGPSRHMLVDFMPRLNLLTGDNGLGKTFILDVAWWALVRRWADLQALPDPDNPDQPTISFLQYDAAHTDPLESRFSFEKQTWALPEKRLLNPAAVLYIRTDGGICLFDPLKGNQPYIFKSRDIWDGLTRGRKQLCNGLIDDWTSWQLRHDEKRENYDLLSEVLGSLSPSDTEKIVPGKPMRISLGDSREIPTIRMPYGNVPVTHASSGCRRILSIAYLLVWMWSENREAAKLTKKAPSDRMVVLFDEVESHLHPQWQRVLVPSLMEVLKQLNPKTDIQLIASTHAPLVLASVEPHFLDEKDALILFDLINGDVRVENMPWQNFGDVSSWLTSDVFGLNAARSLQAEEAIQAALGAINRIDMDSRTLKTLHERLRALLKDTDPFWPRWLYYAEKKGVSL